MKPEFIVPWISGSKNESWIDEYPSSSLDSPYIPIGALTTGDLVSTPERKALFYSLRVPLICEYYIYKKKKRFMDFATPFIEKNYYRDYWIKLDHASISLDYLCNYGMLIYMEEGLYPRPLMMLCAKREELFHIKKDKPDWSQFTLLVDRELIRNEEHLKVYRNLTKYIFEPLEETAKVDILYTDQLLHLCFRNTTTMPKFRTLPEMFGHLEGLNQEVIEALHLP